MLYNTSFTNWNYEKESNEILGEAFSFFEKLKMGGIGSSRLVIDEISHKLKPEKMELTENSYANVELRPKGIIIHFAHRLESYSWLIPYYRLVVYSTEKYTIHSGGSFIKFKKDKNYLGNKKFLKKMMELKNSFSDSYLLLN